VVKDAAVLTDAGGTGRPFQARDTATKNAQLPSAERFIGVTSSISVSATTEKRDGYTEISRTRADKNKKFTKNKN